MIDSRCLFLVFLVIAVLSSCRSQEVEKLPQFIKGTFQDDYSIMYEISDSLWFQKPDARYHIVQVNLEKQYLITRNDTTNPSEPGLYTRFDWMQFTNMAPYTWGFCMTTYNAMTVQEAAQVSSPDRNNPKEGCNGFPFSRMMETK